MKTELRKREDIPPIQTHRVEDASDSAKWPDAELSSSLKEIFPPITDIAGTIKKLRGKELYLLAPGVAKRPMSYLPPLAKSLAPGAAALASEVGGNGGSATGNSSDPRVYVPTEQEEKEIARKVEQAEKCGTRPFIAPPPQDDDNTNSYGKAIRIEGDDAFRQKTITSLDQIAATPSGKDLLASIESSGKTVIIAETSGGNNVSDFSNDALVKSGSKAGTGSNCTVNYNPNRISIGPDPWENRPPAIGLAHELVHAEHATHGTIDVTEVQNDHKPDPANPKAYSYTMKEEARTTGIPPHDDGKFSENKIRSEWTPVQPTRPWY